MNPLHNKPPCGKCQKARLLMRKLGLPVPLLHQPQQPALLAKPPSNPWLQGQSTGPMAESPESMKRPT
jgi:hypothetical protein